MTADGQTMTGQRVPKPVADTAYGLPKGGESDVEELGNGEYYAVKVDEVLPAALPKLDDIRPQITQVWMQQQMMKRMQDKATAAAERVKKGESLQAVAASLGASVETRKGLERSTRGPDIAPQTVGAVFAADPGKPFTAPGARGVLVGVVDAVHEPAPVLAARSTEDARPQISMSLLQGLNEAALRGARTQIKTKIYPKKVDQALGVAPEEGAPAGKSKK
jgi:peptidyl-prolyl cis-trans isomerase D